MAQHASIPYESKELPRSPTASELGSEVIHRLEQMFGSWQGSRLKSCVTKGVLCGHRKQSFRTGAVTAVAVFMLLSSVFISHVVLTAVLKPRLPASLENVPSYPQSLPAGGKIYRLVEIR